jgi:hypothetical protein
MGKVAGLFGGGPGSTAVSFRTRSPVDWEDATSPYLLLAFLPLVVFCVAW